MKVLKASQFQNEILASYNIPKNQPNFRQKSVKNLVGCLGDLKTPKFHSEIKLPLVKKDKTEKLFGIMKNRSQGRSCR